MKAKEFANQYLESPEPKKNGLKMQCLWNLLLEMVKEMRSIGEKRHVQYDNAVAAILREQNQKWEAMRREILKRDNEFEAAAEDAFFRFVEFQLPKFWSAVKRHI